MRNNLSGEKRLLRRGFNEVQMPTIAILDDDEPTRKFLSLILMRAGYEVVAHESKSDFIELLPIFEPDLIVSDIESPRMDGFEFLTAMKSKGIPIIILSGFCGNQNYVEEAKKYGAFSCVEKPVSPEEILGEVKRALEQE